MRIYACFIKMTVSVSKALKTAAAYGFSPFIAAVHKMQSQNTKEKAPNVYGDGWDNTDGEWIGYNIVGPVFCLIFILTMIWTFWWVFYLDPLRKAVRCKQAFWAALICCGGPCLGPLFGLLYQMLLLNDFFKGKCPPPEGIKWTFAASNPNSATVPHSVPQAASAPVPNTASLGASSSPLDNTGFLLDNTSSLLDNTSSLLDDTSPL